LSRRDDPSEIIATLTHAVHAQHNALDLLIARLCASDPTFRPSQSGEIWDAVKGGHSALQDALHWERTH
jgi:hypothetical protein